MDENRCQKRHSADEVRHQHGNSLGPFTGLRSGASSSAATIQDQTMSCRELLVFKPSWGIRSTSLLSDENNSIDFK